VFGAYLAPQLNQAWIGSSIVVAPLYDPLRFAEHCNLQDQLSNGRAIIGVGPGGSPIEFAGALGAIIGLRVTSPSRLSTSR
jgi:alkanesulfonate monooxygenase SsuD/methylene tetrahydromethanopterin reductase-like flavin-dependent oxidoreductase (luciferase family)